MIVPTDRKIPRPDATAEPEELINWDAKEAAEKVAMRVSELVKP